MTVEEYIASGILEIYATGGLAPDEQTEVEEMIRQHPEVKAEINRIEAALETYALAHATTPPAALKDRILSQIEAQPITKTIGNTNKKVVSFSTNTNEQVLGNTRNFNWLAVAATILLLISAGLNYYFYSNWKNTATSLELALNKQALFASNIQQAQYELKQTEIALHVLENTETKHISLEGLPRSPQSKALIHWDPKSKLVLLEVKNLPNAPTGRQYQLWALKDGKPINAGLFDPADTLMGIQHMNAIQDAEAFAMTLEPVGGSTNPTLEEMYLLGKM